MVRLYTYNGINSRNYGVVVMVNDYNVFKPSHLYSDLRITTVTIYSVYWLTIRKFNHAWTSTTNLIFEFKI